MKYLTVLSLVLVLILIMSCTTEKKNKVEGVWEKVSAKITLPDTTMEFTQDDFKQIKVITKSHFVWIGQQPNRAKFVEGGTDSELLAAAKSFGAGGGTYTLEGDIYTEHIEFTLNPNRTGVSIPFTCHIDGDKWIHSGTMPRKSIGQQGSDYELCEVWRRID